MSSKRGGENIWIAYADMLTVLLMVFVLLSMLFQVIVATLRDAKSDSPPIPQKIEETVGAKTESEETVVVDSQDSVVLPLVVVDVQALKPHDGDLRLNVQFSRTYITTPQEEQIRSWVKQNQEQLLTHKLRVYSVAHSTDVSTGDILSMQFNRVVALMTVLRKENFSIQNVLFDNLIVPHNAEDYLILRVEDNAKAKAE